MSNKQLAMSLALGAALMGGISMVDNAQANTDNLFSLNEVASPVLIAEGDHSCGSKEGDSSCGSKEGDHKCGSKDGDHKCGSKDGDHSCGSKDSEHKCGAGSCGSK